MNNKKGFTLVELMAVLVILGVLLLMAMPSITNTFRNSRETEEEEYLNTLCIGVQSYMQFENIDYDTNRWSSTKTKDISVTTLKQSGYIRNNLEKPDSVGTCNTVHIEVDANNNKKCSCK